MTGRELDAAGIREPRLRRAYLRCRELNARHGRTYYLATRLLAPAQRPPVHALYGFARWTDDLVDEATPGTAPATVAARLDELAVALAAGLARGHSDDPVLAAVVDTARRYRIAPELFTAFLRSMRMDLTTTDYPDRAALAEYVHGSAEVIGLQVLPVLGTVTSLTEARGPAAALGTAFQLTNFLRDVAEDLDRGRVYLPADELAAFGVDRALLRWCRDRGRAEPRVRRALADQIATTRAIYRRAWPGIAMLDPVSRPCVATAFRLYGGILERIEAQDHDVFARRVAVGTGRRLAVAGTALSRAVVARGRRRLAGSGPSGKEHI
ncbi:phytoene synthase [Amycolatopsis arida]|uniref:Phytoene synthase n=1 Tax=Amycolatopsis arida TaxID=587909 RepID=A0A1I5XFW5_9PSEU|nr:phytoene/squalene synthase family protein [Amycolatopsis arida]TDX97487.1 phytoene synthase [Amycolatopsis arida]SFQ30716.1 phytoene synthase [Amycolatopsis arida]